MADGSWTFRSYFDSRKVSSAFAWYNSGTPEMRAKFISRLKFLAAAPRDKWVRPLFDVLSGECRGLGEVRFKANKIEHRPLGFFSPGNVFTFVFFAIEKGGSFEPKSACKVGLLNKEEIKKKPERSHVCRFNLG